jgi:long-chain acyl-CoA synthetase
MEKIWLKHYSPGIPTEINLDQYRSIVHVFETACRRFPNHKAFTNFGITMTYGELAKRSNEFAAFLQNDLKLVKGDRIAIQLPNLLQFPVCLYGALKAGLVIVNTNPLYTEREMQHQFADSGAKAIVILANFAHHLEDILSETKIEHVIVTALGDALPLPKRLLINTVIKYVKKMVPRFSLPRAYTYNQALELGRKSNLKEVDLTLADTAFLQYTGGTTGVAKGAMLTHKNIVANMEQICLWMLSRLKEGEETVYMPLPMYHIFCMTVNGLAILKFGGHNIMNTNPKDLGSVLKDLRTYKCTIMTGVNTLFNALLNNPEFAKLDFSKLKVSVAGGMALQTAVNLRWKEVTKSMIVEGYGLTETSPVVCCNPVDGTDRVGTIGLPLPSTEIKMIDEEGKEVALGQPGELCVRGPQVMKGYWQHDSETALVLDADGWLKTGDIGQSDPDGFIKIVDRKKDMILVSGFNVYPNEIEDVIAKHPGVLEVAAVGIPDAASGEVVKIFVVRKGSTNVTAEELIKFARESLTGYKIPRAVEFRTELPKTNVGKILRRALR